MCVNNVFIMTYICSWPFFETALKGNALMGALSLGCYVWSRTYSHVHVHVLHLLSLELLSSDDIVFKENIYRCAIERSD